jgi:hypothetical protein
MVELRKRCRLRWVGSFDIVGSSKPSFHFIVTHECPSGLLVTYYNSQVRYFAESALEVARNAMGRRTRTMVDAFFVIVLFKLSLFFARGYLSVTWRFSVFGHKTIREINIDERLSKASSFRSRLHDLCVPDNREISMCFSSMHQRQPGSNMWTLQSRKPEAVGAGLTNAGD